MSEDIYRFRTNKGKRYMVRLERYKHSVYIIKFHLTEHKDYRYKYNIRTNDFDAFRILNTCINICLDVLDKEPAASFGFIGAQVYYREEKRLEDMRNNKRFRVYTGKALNHFSPDTFQHEEMIEKSGYLLLNRKNKMPNLKAEIEKMFNELYILDDNHSPIPIARGG